MIRVVDSHTGGEPTRMVIGGGPDLGTGPLARRLDRFRKEFDTFRRTVILEPRGSDILVGALLCTPESPGNTAGAIFFNNSGYLGMCGHGTIGVAATLAHLGRIAPGRHTLETPVGTVTMELVTLNRVTIGNVPSRRHRKEVEVEVPGLGRVRGDVAWGGNWFFLCGTPPCPLRPAHVETLTRAARGIRRALRDQGITGENDAEIDHVEFFGPPETPGAHSRNFVLCPGDAYDRSPCGTGTSAKLACLASDGAWPAGRVWIQESILGSRFEASWREGAPGEILPTITGEAYVTGETALLQHPEDPFAGGILPS